MKVIIVDDTNRDYFLDMDPLYIMERSKRIGSACMGVMEEGEDGFDVPCGLLIGLQYDKRLILLWMYVRPEFRGKGIGGRMLKKAAEAAKEYGLDWVCAFFEDVPGRFNVTGDYDRSYFMAQGFREDERVLPLSAGEDADFLVKETEALLRDEAKPWDMFADILEADMAPRHTKSLKTPPWYELAPEKVVTVDALRKAGDDFMAILKDTALKIGSVGDCSLPFFYYMLWVCLNKGNSGMLEELSDRTDRIPLNWFSPEASCFLLEGDQLAGMFLVGVGENLELVPALLYVQGDSYRQKVSALMSFAGKKLCEEYDGDTDVVLYAGDEVSKIFAQSMGIR